MKESLKSSEERKRERCWDARDRWRVLQETITWAEAQETVQRGSPANRLVEERRKLDALRTERGGSLSGSSSGRTR